MKNKLTSKTKIRKLKVIHLNDFSSENLELTIIDNQKEIKIAQDIFLFTFFENADEIITTNKIGHQGSNLNLDAFWSNKLGIWIANRETKGNTRYWNAFGIQKPNKSSVPIICEINFPIKGINRRVQGAFAKDNNNEIYVLHRGKLGGNYSGQIFKDNYSGKWTKVNDGNTETEFIVIGKLNDPNLINKVRDFVYEIHEIKQKKAKLLK